jgi:hypothetical protein
MTRVTINFTFLLLLLFYSPPGHSQVLSLDHLSLDVARYSGNREPQTPDIPIHGYKGYVQLNWDVGLLGDYVKWENKVKTAGTYSQFETVSWEYQLSIPTRWGIEPFLYHKSQHRMDDRQPVVLDRTKPERFPVSDAVGIRFTFFNRVK